MSMEAWTDEAILGEIGGRLRRERLNRNLTMRSVAERAGVSVSTLANVEDGESYSMSTLLGVLRALELLGRLDALLPEPTASPIELAKLRGKPRRRATGSRGRRKDAEPWEW